MSQVTRCPACQTSFRVVADQLKIAQGWVRCGRCAEVFDASAQFVPEPAAGSPGPGVPSTVAEPPIPEEPEQQAIEAPSLQPALADQPSAGAAATQALPTAEIPANGGVAAATAPVVAPLEQAVPDTLRVPEADSAPEVSFVRDARRREFWQKPPIRFLLGTLAALLLGALALQWTVRQRHALAAMHPALMPVLHTLCGALGCDIRPLRRIASLAIESASFSKTAADSYRLGFVLKNNDAVPLEIPAMEVTLIDSREQALLRRVLTPAQFGAIAATLGARQELNSAVSLRVSAEAPTGAASLAVTGYRLLAFYP